MSVWDQRYASEEYQYGTVANDFLRQQAARLAPASRVLCLAEGEGRNGVFLARQGHRVTGVDASRVGLAKAQALARCQGVDLVTVVADLAAYEPGVAVWDAVVSVFAHLPPPVRRVLRPRVAAAVVPGGLLLLEHYHPRQLEYRTGGPPEVAMLTTLAELAEDFASWEVLHAFEGEREIHEGILHDGLSFVTQFVARKPTAAGRPVNPGGA